MPPPLCVGAAVYSSGHVADLPYVSANSLVVCVQATRRTTSSSAIAEGPRDALSQLKSCQLLYNCAKNHI